jgi:hypothetical protein
LVLCMAELCETAGYTVVEPEVSSDEVINEVTNEEIIEAAAGQTAAGFYTHPVR